MAAGIFHVAGLDGVLLVKAAVLLGTIGLLGLASGRFPRLLVWGGAAATAMGLLGFLEYRVHPAARVAGPIAMGVA